MVCDFCHEREAVIFLEQVSGDGSKRKICMCKECAIERGVSSDPKNIESSIGSLFSELAEITKRLKADAERLCPVCGTSVGKLRKTFLAGCPECYAIFKADVQKLLGSKNISGNYSGTMPARLASFKSVLNDRIILQNKLDMAVKNEDYEKAAMYRDYLRALEKNAVAPSGEEDDLNVNKADDLNTNEGDE